MEVEIPVLGYIIRDSMSFAFFSVLYLPSDCHHFSQCPQENTDRTVFCIMACHLHLNQLHRTCNISPVIQMVSSISVLS